MQLQLPSTIVKDSTLQELQQQMDQLRMMSRSELKSLFARLVAPPIEELNGEYRSSLLLHDKRPISDIITFFFNLRGTWQGKAFCPVNENEGHGYNNFLTRHGVQQRYRMQTTIADSILDRRKSYRLEYRGLNYGLIGTMVDELRRVQQGLYLGFGLIGPSFTPRISLRGKIFFALIGPVSEFRHSGN